MPTVQPWSLPSWRTVLRALGIRGACGLGAAVLALAATALAREGHVLWFCVLALTAMALALVGWRGLVDREFRRRRVAPWSAFGGMEFWSGALAVSAGVLLILWSGWEFTQRDEHFRVPWLAWIAGALLVLLGFCLLDRRATAIHRRLERGVTVRVGPGAVARWGLLALVLFAAATVRFVDLETHPVGLDRDEMSHLSRALTLGDSSEVPPYVRSITTPAAYPMMVHRTAELVGVSAATPRLVSAFLGLLGIFAVFLLGRRMMGWPLGLLSAATLASLAWDINFSRIGWENIAVSTCAALAAWSALRALSTGRISDFALAGALAASGFWFYEAYYPFPIVLGFVLACGLLRARPELRRRVAAGAAVMGLLGVVWLAPLLAYAVDEPSAFTARGRGLFSFTDERRESNLERLPERMGDYLGSLHVEGDRGPRHNIHSRPMMDLVSGAMLLLGLALAATRWRRVGLVMLLVWLPVMVLPGLLSETSNGIIVRRIPGLLPAVALLAALPLAICWRGVARCGAWWRALARGAVVSAVLFSAFYGVRQYFVEQPAHPAMPAEYNTDLTLLAYDIPRQLGRGYAVAVTPRWDGDAGAWGRLLTVWPEPATLKVPESIPVDPRTFGDRRGVVVYVSGKDAGIVDTLIRFYPYARVNAALVAGSDQPLFYQVVIGREHLWAAAGLSAGDGAPALTGTRPLPSGEYRGLLRVRRDGEYEFMLRDGREVSVALDGRDLLPGGSDRARLQLKAGFYQMEIRVGADAGSGAALLWMEPDANDFVPIGVANLYSDEGS